MWSARRTLLAGVVIILALPIQRACAQQAGDYSGSCTASKCHDGYGKSAVVHSPVQSGDCDSCHESTGQAEHKFKFVVEKAELCLECHEEIIEDLTFLHGPVAAGACTSCHNPHASDHPSLLLADGRDLCSKCHTDILERIATSTFSHEPARNDCTACHSPHGGDNKMSLTTPSPELCLDCHDDMADTIDDASVTHDPVTDGRGCTNCHDPHASKFEHGLLKKPMELCLSCHNKELDSDKGRIQNIAERLSSKAWRHGPIAQGDCTSCHKPHGGENFRMLAEAYPATPYAPYEEDRYALCFGCHDVEAMEDEQTDDLTKFRNGERNLHYLHVNRTPKGRTCRFCHDPHASSTPVHITDSVAFGEWRIPINFEQTATGGSCAPGCHKPYGYDRETPKVNLPAP